MNNGHLTGVHSGSITRTFTLILYSPHIQRISEFLVLSAALRRNEPMMSKIKNPSFENPFLGFGLEGVPSAVEEGGIGM